MFVIQHPAAPRGNGPQARTCCLSACSWLRLLKSWSLRQTRSGSVNVSEEQLKSAPKYPKHESWDWSDRARGQTVYDYYGAAPY